MYELSKSISKKVWNNIKEMSEYSEKQMSEYSEKQMSEYSEKYESPNVIKLRENSITEGIVMRSVIQKFPNLYPIEIKDVSNKESNHGLDFIIEDKSSKKYIFAFQAKVLRGDKYPEIAHISGRKKPESHMPERENPEYQVEKIFRTQHVMRKEFGKDKYFAYYIFYNYLDCESEIFKSVKDCKNNSFTPLHGVTAAPIELIYNYLTKLPQYNKEKPKNISSKYKKVDKISPFTRPWEHIFEESDVFNRKEYTMSEKGFGLMMSKTIPLKFMCISTKEIPDFMSPEEYISYFCGEGKEYLLSEINIPKYVIFGKVNFTI